MNLFDSLSAALEDSTMTEREVHKLLKKDTGFVTGLFADSWNYTNTFSEVWFASDYRVDFLTLCANSGHWIAHAIELKSPSAKLYVKSGSKSKALQLVERQISERANWRRENELAFRQVLAKLVSEDTAAQCSNASIHTRARSELLDPRTVIHLHCHAVIGRSSKMSDQERAIRRLDEQKRGEWGSPAVLTYDRVLTKAKLACTPPDVGT